jgi:hypothetical protein
MLPLLPSSFVVTLVNNYFDINLTIDSHPLEAARSMPPKCGR